MTDAARFAWIVAVELAVLAVLCAVYGAWTLVAIYALGIPPCVWIGHAMHVYPARPWPLNAASRGKED